MIKTPNIIIALGSAIMIMSGCVSPPKTIVWDPDSNESIKHFQQPVVAETEKDYALIELWRAQLFFENGDRQHSDERLRNALGVMEQIESDSREASAVVVAEQLRTYRGQPYERATAYFYRGLCHFQLGHYEQALAAFRATLAEDEETNNKEPSKRKDYVAAYYMAAECHKLLGEIPESNAMLASARELFPENPLLKPESLQGNLIIVAGVGVGPWMKEGAFWTVEFNAGVVPEGKYCVLEQDTTCGQLYEATDLLVQADSHKPGSATGAAIGRAVGKEVANAFLSALAGRDAGLHEHRDLRCWSGMPRKLYIGSFNLPQGLHTLTFDIVATEKQQAGADRYHQTWYDIPVQDNEHPQLFYVRLSSNRQNAHNLVPVPLQDVLAQKNANKNNK